MGASTWAGSIQIPDTATPRASEDDILYQVFDPGSGEPLQVSDIALTITVPTKFFLFDQDGSETLDLILVQGLSDFGHSLAVGYQDVNFDFDPGPYLDPAWVIQRGHSAEEDALLDALIADPDNTNIIINLSGPNPGPFNFGINGMTAEASNALTHRCFSRTIDVQFVDNNDEPTLTATGNDPTFAEGGAAADLYGSVTASTVDSGQTFTSLTLTVTNVTDGANEVLRINGIDVALTHANSVNVTVGTATVTLAGTTATVALSGLALSEVQLQTLVDGLAYRNDSQIRPMPTGWSPSSSWSTPAGPRWAGTTPRRSPSPPPSTSIRSMTRRRWTTQFPTASRRRTPNESSRSRSIPSATPRVIRSPSLRRSATTLRCPPGSPSMARTRPSPAPRRSILPGSWSSRLPPATPRSACPIRSA